MKNKHQEQWERLGSCDPYWAVLTNPKMKGGKWNSSDFFKSGEIEIDNIISKIEGLDANLVTDVALDFGCGVGRLSRSLARKYRKVIAIDVSSSMLAEAQSANNHIDNINYVHNTTGDLAVISSNSVDFVYSNIVLQHMPSIRQTAYIEEFCRVLRPGGCLAFQTPSSYNLKTSSGWLHIILGNKILNIIRRIKYGAERVMEMHTLAKDSVLKILGREKMNVLLVERFDSSGPTFKSYMYIATKS